MSQRKTPKANPKPKRRRTKRPDPLEQLAPDDRQALAQIGTRPGCSMRTVLAAAGCSRGAGARTVKKLMDLGLVRRDESSRPFRHFCTTPGYKLRERICIEA